MIEQEEELRASYDTSEKGAESLHNLIDNLKKKVRLLQEMLDKKDIEFEKKLKLLQENIEKKVWSNKTLLNQDGLRTLDPPSLEPFQGVDIPLACCAGHSLIFWEP